VQNNNSNPAANSVFGTSSTITKAVPAEGGTVEFEFDPSGWTLNAGATPATTKQAVLENSFLGFFTPAGVTLHVTSIIIEYVN
jgi:hypothetical protein